MRNDPTRQVRRPPSRAMRELPRRSARQAELHRRQDALLDQALLETFPASDPISVMQIT